MQLHPATCSYKLQARKGFHSDSQLQATVAHGYTSPGTGFFLVADLAPGRFGLKVISAVASYAATTSYMAAPEGGTCSWPSGQPLPMH
jgi:hypothetical protein